MASYVGLDIGEKRIGVAICDVSAPFPAPLMTLEANPDLAGEFAQVIKKHAVQAVVVGLPRNQSGERTAQTDRVEKIVQLLQIPETVPVYFQDESLTSVKAEDELNRRKKPFSKGDIDALAATYILNDFVQTQLPSIKHQQTVEPTGNQKAPSTHKPSDKKGKNPKQKSLRKKLFTLLGLITVLAICAAIGIIGWYQMALGPRTSEDVYHVITVKSGSSTQDIAENLEQKNVIKSAKAFSIYIRLNSVANLQAGTYRLSSKQSVAQITDVLASGKVTTVNVLISPGQRIDQITAALVKDGYSRSEIDAALLAVRDHPLLANVSENARLEGYLFPDTYKIDPTTSAEDLLRLMLDTFQKKITPDVRAGIKAQGLTVDQAIILASIVQKEVADPEVQRTVAQVFIKRLSEGVVLGSDVTYKYAAAQFGTIDSPASNSPYNTRRFGGLPPTAIANFNFSALKAVASPTATDYNFFVAGDDGTTYFSRTEAEHEAYADKYCTKECR